jgi:hypothetical protein
MTKEKIEKVYSLHRFLDENGAPDRKKIFSVREKLWMPGHLNPELKNIWHNQPEDVQVLIREHLSTCDRCKNEFETKDKDFKDQDLPF